MQNYAVLLLQPNIRLVQILFYLYLSVHVYNHSGFIFFIPPQTKLFAGYIGINLFDCLYFFHA